MNELVTGFKLLASGPRQFGAIQCDSASGLKGPRVVGANREEELPCYGKHENGCLEKDYVG